MKRWKTGTGIALVIVTILAMPSSPAQAKNVSPVISQSAKAYIEFAEWLVWPCSKVLQPEVATASQPSTSRPSASAFRRYWRDSANDCARSARALEALPLPAQLEGIAALPHFTHLLYVAVNKERSLFLHWVALPDAQLTAMTGASIQRAFLPLGAAYDAAYNLDEQIQHDMGLKG
jgi:hypothetical protein